MVRKFGNGIWIMIVISTIYLLIAIIKVIAGEISEGIDYSSPVVCTVIKYQNALKNKEYEEAWALQTRLIQKIAGDFENYKNGWWEKSEHQDYWQTVYSIELEEVKFITDRTAAAIVSDNPYSCFPCFYLIKENGEWKIGDFGVYLRKAKGDIELLAKAIEKYCAENTVAPKSLSELTPDYIEDIPSDPFNAAGETYVYLSFENKWRLLYSLGPDGDDDYGLVEYNFEEGTISNGDILKRW